MASESIEKPEQAFYCLDLWWSIIWVDFTGKRGRRLFLPVDSILTKLNLTDCFDKNPYSRSYHKESQIHLFLIPNTTELSQIQSEGILNRYFYAIFLQRANPSTPQVMRRLVS